MRISTYQTKLSKVLQYRPRFETENVEATVTLTGDDNVPMIDLTFKEEQPTEEENNIETYGQTKTTVTSIPIADAKLLADWVKKVAR